MRILTLLLAAMCITATALAQSPQMIRLNSPASRDAPARVRIVVVEDKRSDTSVIGAARSGVSKRLRAVSLEGGVAPAIAAFLSRYQNAAPKAIPLTMQIRQLEVSQEGAGARERVSIRFKYAFVWEDGELSYDGSAFAESNADVSPYIEKLVRESLTATFDKVAGAEQIPDPAKPPVVSIQVKMEPQPGSTGLITFDRNRPLRYEDFRAQPNELSTAAAATYSGMSFAFSAQQQGSDFRIILTLSAIVDPEKSWMRSIGRNSKVLAHENLHFAITAMMACKLADTLRRATITKDGYEAQIRQVFNAVEREQQRAQELYDAETKHGTIPGQQQAWETWVYDELKRMHCYGY